jgi:hypothetical protein
MTNDGRTGVIHLEKKLGSCEYDRAHAGYRVAAKNIKYHLLYYKGLYPLSRFPATFPATLRRLSPRENAVNGPIGFPIPVPTRAMREIPCFFSSRAVRVKSDCKNSNQSVLSPREMDVILVFIINFTVH